MIKKFAVNINFKCKNQNINWNLRKSSSVKIINKLLIQIMRLSKHSMIGSCIQ